MAKAGCYLRHHSGFDVFVDQRSATARGHRRFHGYLLYNLYLRSYSGIAHTFDIIKIYIFIPQSACSSSKNLTVCPLCGEVIWLAFFLQKFEAKLHEKSPWFVCCPDFRLALSVQYSTCKVRCNIVYQASPPPPTHGDPGG